MIVIAGVYLRELFETLNKNGDRVRDIDWYMQHKLECLNEKSFENYTADSFVEGNNLLYVYCGHDGESFIANIESEDEMKKLIHFYTKNARRYWYFDCVSIIDGVIKIH